MASSTSPLELLVLRLPPAACDRRDVADTFGVFVAVGAALADLRESLAMLGVCDAVAPDRVARGVAPNGYFSFGLTKVDMMIRTSTL